MAVITCGNNILCSNNLLVGSQATNRISIDLTTLEGWATLADGTYNITLVAMADGYRDSDPSEAVEVTKITYDYTVDGNILILDNAPYIQNNNELEID